MFSADGELVEAKPEARERLAHGRDLSCARCRRASRAKRRSTARPIGDSDAGAIALWRLGAGPTFLLLAVFSGEGAGAAGRACRPRHHRGDGAADRAHPPADRRTEPAEAPQRRMPLRFVWQMDASNRFTSGVEDFARLLGPNTAAVLIRPWAEIAETLKIDSRGQIARALSLHSTWSGIVVDWPTDEAGERLPIEMSGLPVFDRDRQYAGYRGFGICRDMDKLALLEQHRAQTRRRHAAATQAGRAGAQGGALPLDTAAAAAAVRAAAPTGAAAAGRANAAGQGSRRGHRTAAAAHQRAGADAQPRRAQRLPGTGARIERAAQARARRARRACGAAA